MDQNLNPETRLPFHPRQDFPLAVSTLKEELREFSFDGLVSLLENLEKDVVPRGSWGGCPLSYRGGFPGSARRDCNGNARNAFTVFWDSEWISREEVLDFVRWEFLRRTEHLPLEVTSIKIS